MKIPQRIISNEIPDTIQKLGNGTYYYNYDIKEEKEMTAMYDDEGSLPLNSKMYSFIQVYIIGDPNYKECVKAIIRQYVDEDEEFDLINDYNRSMLNLGGNTDKYIEYLKLVESIKIKVRSDYDK